MAASCGIDWVDEDHEVAILDQDGKLIGKCRITDDADGFRPVVELLAAFGDTAEGPFVDANAIPPLTPIES